MLISVSVNARTSYHICVTMFSFLWAFTGTCNLIFRPLSLPPSLSSLFLSPPSPSFSFLSVVLFQAGHQKRISPSPAGMESSLQHHQTMVDMMRKHKNNTSGNEPSHRVCTEFPLVIHFLTTVPAGMSQLTGFVPSSL